MIPPTVAAAVRSVPAAVAALGSAPAQPDVLTPGAVGGPVPNGGADGVLDAVVVDAGHSGTEITRVSGGRVVSACRVPVGGAVLDDVAAELLGGAARIPRADRAEIRAARERLSLQPVARVGEPPVDQHADVLCRALAPHLAAVVDGVRTVRLACAPRGVDQPAGRAAPPTRPGVHPAGCRHARAAP